SVVSGPTLTGRSPSSWAERALLWPLTELPASSLAPTTAARCLPQSAFIYIHLRQLALRAGWLAKVVLARLSSRPCGHSLEDGSAWRKHVLCSVSGLSN